MPIMLRVLLLVIIYNANVPANARGGSPGEGGSQLFIGLVLVLGVGYLLSKISAQTLKAVGGLILVVSALSVLFNIISAMV